ncbi:MAG: S9 family peptidase [Agriterribacter sp.]
MDVSRQQHRLFSLDDLTEMTSVSSIALSPEGNQLVCVVTTIVNDQYKDEITLIDLSTGEQKSVAQGSSPQWSPDGKSIAFIGDNNGVVFLSIYDLKLHQVKTMVKVYASDYFIDHYAMQNFCWSPDGNSIAYVSAAPLEENNQVQIVATDLLYKTKGGRGRNGYAGKALSQIWLLNIKENTNHRVFESAYHEHSISFSSNGKELCFISNRSGHPDLNQWSDVFTVEIETGKVKRISSEKGSAFQPCWSPDGKYIAYMGITNELSTNDSLAEDTQLYIVPSTGGSAVCLTRILDRRVEQLCWENNSKSIFFTVGDKGNIHLYKVSPATGDLESIIARTGKLLEYSVSSDGKNIVYIFTDSTHRPEIFVYDLAVKQGTQLTHFNKRLDTCGFQPSETFWYKSFDECEIQGWIIKPSHFDEQKKYPLILVIHGGPHNMFGYEFEDRMQLLSARGYAVFFINPRGSSGYGQAFSNGTLNAWGEGDYKDLMTGVDHIIKQHPWVDEERLGVTGQSYGGYMTNRIITKTKRFKAAVADGSISNLISFAGTSLYHSLMESEFQGSVYNNYEVLWNCSPLKDIKKASTPVLLLHGETDNEVPVSQAEEMYIALKRLGVETELVIYRGEGHGWRPDLSPANRKDLLKRMIAWFDKHLI